MFQLTGTNEPPVIMHETYYLTINDSDPFVPLDPSTTWALFVLTVIIQGFTFWGLEYCSNTFRDFDCITMSPTEGRGINTANMESLLPPSATPVRSMCNMNGYSQLNTQSRISPHAKINYQHFHDTLDVSVFR